jgi:CDP-diacylglycerol--serine O-phosphatidyltransferase
VDIEPDTRKRRGVFLLPNLFTTAGLFAGFYSIVAAIGQRFELAAIAVFVAMVMDGLDGRIARLTHTQSAFGVQYDSLADMVAFGIAPALMMYVWTLVGMGKLGWLAAFLYAAGAALRLARFNTQVGTTDKRYFQGLASPAAAAVLAGLVWLGQANDIGGADLRLPALVLTVLLALLMVSNVRYHSFKNLDLRGRVPFITGLVIVLAFVLISLNPPEVLFLGFLGYAFSGPLLTLVQLQRRRAQRRAAGRRGQRSGAGAHRDE